MSLADDLRYGVFLVGTLLLTANTSFCEPLKVDLTEGKREIVYELTDYSMMKPSPSRVRVKLDSDVKATFKQMFNAKDTKPWSYSEEVLTSIELSGDSLSFSYQNKSGKREDAVNTHIYILHPTGSKVLCGGQESIRLRGGKVFNESLVPNEETNLYQTADKIDAFLNSIPDSNEPPTLSSAGKTLLVKVADEEDRNAYERLMDRIPGKTGLVISFAMKGTKYVMESVEDDRRTQLLELTDGGYSLTKLDLYGVKQAKRTLLAKNIGRKIDLSFKHTFGKPVYLLAHQISFEDAQKARRSDLRDLVMNFSLSKNQGIEGDADGILGFLQGKWDWISGGVDVWEVKEESQSFEIIANRLTMRAIVRPPKVFAGRVRGGNDWKVKAREFSITDPVQKNGEQYILTLRETERDRTTKLGVSRMTPIHDHVRFATLDSDMKEEVKVGVFRNASRSAAGAVTGNYDVLKGSCWCMMAETHRTGYLCFGETGQMLIFESDLSVIWITDPLLIERNDDRFVFKLPAERGLILDRTNVRTAAERGRPDMYLALSTEKPSWAWGKITETGIEFPVSKIMRKPSEAKFKKLKSRMPIGLFGDTDARLKALEAIASSRKGSHEDGEQIDPNGSNSQWAENACINNLRRIDAAKEQWAFRSGAKTGAVIVSEANAYIKDGAPRCPAGGTYTYNNLGVNPTCGVSGHVL